LCDPDMFGPNSVGDLWRKPAEDGRIETSTTICKLLVCTVLVKALRLRPATILARVTSPELRCAFLCAFLFTESEKRVRWTSRE
jgi:hypothetical protein